MIQRRKTTTARRTVSSVVPVRRSAIKDTVRLLLFAKAGGRCEFDGCNEYLLEHPVTHKEGLFSTVAHIVAYRPEGPRGQDGLRPSDINNPDNLMLLCPQCHKLVDDHPADYPRTVLEDYKRIHEQRIRQLTALGPDRQTLAVVFKAPIRRQTVAIPFSHIVSAVSPRYPSSRTPFLIDLTGLVGQLETPEFITLAEDNIKRRLAELLAPGGEFDRVQHLSLFALGPIPLLIRLGRAFSNKIPMDVYQRHRDTENWTWKAEAGKVRYSEHCIQDKGKSSPVALVLALSGPIGLDALPDEVRKRSTIYAISLEGRKSDPTFLRTRADLDVFRIAYQAVLATITSTHGLLASVDLFPAVPAPIAVLVGRELLPKVHPSLRVHDYDKARNGFSLMCEINNHD